MVWQRQSVFSMLAFLVLATTALAVDAAPVTIPQDDQLRREIMEKVERQLREQREELMRDIDRIVRDAIASRENEALRRAHRRIEELEREVERLRAGRGGEEQERRRARRRDRERSDEPAILGFGFSDTDADLARRLGTDPAKCLQVSSVIPGTPAAKVLRPGDLIVRADGVEASEDRFLELMRTKRPGDRISLNIVRDVDGNRVQIETETSVVARSRFAEAIARVQGAGGEEEPGAQRAPEERPRSDQPVRLGVEVQQTDDFKLVIQQVEPGTNAAEAGLKIHDVLTELNGRSLRTLEDVKEALASVRAGAETTLRYQRGHEEFLATMIMAAGDGKPRLLSLDQKSVGGEHSEPEAESRRPGFLGVELSSVEGGLRIEFVQPGSAADDMGLEAGDVITGLNGKATADLPALREVLGGLHAGDQVRVRIRRGDDTRTVRGRLGARDEPQASRAAAPEVPQVAVTPAVKRSGPPKPGALGLVAEMNDGRVQVHEVLAGSAAGAAGVQAGDFIVKVGSSPVDGFASLHRVLAGKKVGDRLELTVDRGGKSRSISVTLAALTGNEAMAATIEETVTRTDATPTAASAGGRSYVGITIEEMTGSPLRIVTVEADSPASRAGLRDGDTVISIDGSPVDTLNRVRDLLSQRRAGDRTEFRLSRNGREITISVTLGAANP